MNSSQKIGCISWAIVTLCTIPTSVYAAGFQLYEENISGLGNYHAGWAVDSEDASATFYNPAALTTLKHHQFVLSTVAIKTHLNFAGSSAVQVVGGGVNSAESTAGQTSGIFTVIPQFYIAGPITDRLAYGFGLAVPYGLATNWADDSVVRYAATLTKVQVLDFTPSLAYAIRPDLSFGLGIDVQRLSAVFAEAIPSIAVFPFTADEDTISKNSGVSYGLGWHAGFLYHFTPRTDIGYSFRSSVPHHLKGTSESLAYGATSTGSPPISDATVDVTIPASMALSVGHQATDKWRITGTWLFTRWEVIDSITLRNVNISGSALDVFIPHDFKNTWGVLVGNEYAITENTTLKCGVGFETPVVDNASRDMRLPEEHRLSLAVGAKHKFSHGLKLDVGLARIIMKTAEVNKVLRVDLSPMDAVDITTQGRVKNAATVAGAQLSWDFW